MEDNGMSVITAMRERKQPIWDILAMEEPRYFIRDEEHPAFVIAHGIFYLRRTYPKKDPKYGYSLYMLQVGLIDNFSSFKKAEQRLREIIENANYPLKVWKYQNDKTTLFAECKQVSELYRSRKEGRPIRAFNIREWAVEKK